ncbi:MAG: MaoC family dehydratase N-terminal domain-containing protein, partial [SAR202 cluster bacterium]|nr:MaoC family dehydratase N-terminal domain-containing protein [SAR202 cluster bacterium]
LGFAAGDEWESFKPVRPGDVLSVTTILGDIWEKQGRPGIGRMLFVRVDNTIRNQRNEIVSIHRYTQVNYEGPTD